MNHSDKPKEYDQGIFAELIKQGRIKHLGTRKDLVKDSMNDELKKQHEELVVIDEKLKEIEKDLSPTWWHYLIVRKELKDGPLLAQLAHAAGYSAALLGKPLPLRTRVVVLQATKEQFGDVYGKIMDRKDDAGKTLFAMYEEEGQLKGCYTAMGFLTCDKQSIIDVVGGLDLWKKKASVVITGNTVGGSIAGGDININK